MLTDFLRQQFAAYASMPISLARLLAASADAAEASVSLLRQLDDRAVATNRVLHSLEDPLVRLAEAVDATLVDQMVEALGRLPVVLTRAAALTDRAEGVLSGLEAPVRALGPLTSALDVGRIGGLVDRLEESIPGAGLLLRRVHPEDLATLPVDTADPADPPPGRPATVARSTSARAPRKATKARRRGRTASGERSDSRATPAEPEDGGA